MVAVRCKIHIYLDMHQIPSRPPLAVKTVGSESGRWELHVLDVQNAGTSDTKVTTEIPVFRFFRPLRRSFWA